MFRLKNMSCTFQNRMWRKTRSRNKDGSYGADPNRNFNYHFAGSFFIIFLVTAFLLPYRTLKKLFHLWCKLYWQSNTFRYRKPSGKDRNISLLPLLSTLFVFNFRIPQLQSINRACANDASNPKKKRKLLQHLKGVKSR